MTIRSGEDAPFTPYAAARAVAVDRELTHTALRVLKYLESILGYKLPVGVAQKTIAQELGVSTDEVARVMRQLRTKGIIEQTRDAHLKAVFRFNPSYGSHEQARPPEPETKVRREVMTPEQELLAASSPTLFEL